MPKCGICTKSNKTVYKCKECNIQFCEKCGDKTRLFCSDCVDYVEGAMGRYKPDQEIETDTD